MKIIFMGKYIEQRTFMFIFNLESICESRLGKLYNNLEYLYR